MWSSAMATMTRGVRKDEARLMPPMETSVPAVTSRPPPVPRKTAAAVAIGVFVSARSGPRTPMDTVMMRK